MTDTEMRIAVAEAMGWVSNGAGAWHRNGKVRTLEFEDLDGRGVIHPLPDYPNSRDACVEFEDWMRKNMGIKLYEMYGKRLAEANKTESWTCAETDAATATPRQRCVEFLYVYKLWKEGAR